MLVSSIFFAEVTFKSGLIKDSSDYEYDCPSWD